MSETKQVGLVLAALELESYRRGTAALTDDGQQNKRGVVNYEYGYRAALNDIRSKLSIRIWEEHEHVLQEATEAAEAEGNNAG